LDLTTFAAQEQSQQFHFNQIWDSWTFAVINARGSPFLDLITRNR
jgi:hypothetical protein